MFTKFKLSLFGQSKRWLGLLLVGFFTALSLSLAAPSVQAQDDEFCVASSEPIADPVQGRSYGDPHINTYDGLHYSFQMAGEFILSKAHRGSFQVQARQKPVANRSNVSLNSAVAMDVCGHRVAIYAQDIPDGGTALVWIDGIASPVTEVLPLPAGGEIQMTGSQSYAVVWPSGDQVLTRFITVGGDRFLNIMPTLSRAHTSIPRGLLGNFNRDADDDLMGRDGTVVPAESSYSLATNVLDRALPSVIPVRQVEDAYFERLYRQFGNSWRITQAESLFDYRPGESTATFTNEAFPTEFITLNAVAPTRVRSALETCQNAGVEEALLDGCVFDVAATGQSDFANAAVNAIANAVTREIRDRIIDEVRDALPIPRFPF